MNFFGEIFSNFRFPQDALDILIVTVVFYNLFLLIRGTRAIQMLFGFTPSAGSFRTFSAPPSWC